LLSLAITLINTTIYNTVSCTYLAKENLSFAGHEEQVPVVSYEDQEDYSGSKEINRLESGTHSMLTTQ
jgi:hypothetical protein